MVADDSQASSLAEFVAWLVEECGAESRASWVDWADWARRFLHTILGSTAARRRWPEAELAAYDAVERAIEDLRPIGAIEPGPITRERMRAQLATMLDAPAGRRGRFGVGVLYGSLTHVLGVELDMLIVLGMAEGSFPPMGVRSSVLSDAERVVIESPFAPLARACDERRSFLAAVCVGGQALARHAKGRPRSSRPSSAVVV